MASRPSHHDAGRRAAERALADVQAAAQAAPAADREGLAQVAFAQAATVELDEAATRVLIDDQLRAAGWTVDSRALRHAAGTRPQVGQAIAIAELATASSPAVGQALAYRQQASALVLPAWKDRAKPVASFRSSTAYLSKS